MRHAVIAILLGLAVTFDPIASSAESLPAITQGGARCDGKTDDTASINGFLAGFKAGGSVRIPANRMCLIASGDLVIPPSVIVSGSGAAGQQRGDAPTGSGFLLDPAFTIRMSHNAALRDVAVLRAGLLSNPTDAQVIAAVEAWGEETSSAITLMGGGVRLRHLYIEGFNTAITSFGWGTFIISDVMGDTYNGVFISGAGDNMAVADTRFEPFYAIRSANAHVGAHAPLKDEAGRGTRLRFDSDAISQVQPGDYAALMSGPRAGAIPPGTTVVSVDAKSGEVELSKAPATPLASGDVINFGGSWARPGVSFYFQGNTTGWYCQRCFSFMYRHGAVIDSAGIGAMTDADFEYQHAFDPGSDGIGTFGVRLAGGSAGVSIDRSSMGGQAIALTDDMAPPHEVHMSNLDLVYPDFIITANAGGPNGIAGAWFSGRTGDSVVVKVSGSAPPGSDQTLVVNGETFSYAGAAGGGPRRIASAWARALNSDPALVAKHVVGYFRDDTLTIYAPPGVALTVSNRLSAPVTATLRKGQPSPGAWGSINGFSYNGPARIPAVVVRPHDDLPLLFSNFPGDNTGNMPSGAFAIDPTDTKVQFLTYPAGAAGNSVLSGCGRDPSLAPGSTALRGTITEGIAASGCTLTFPATFPRAPVCTVSSPSGSGIAGYAVTERALTIRNPSGNRNEYTFMCSP